MATGIVITGLDSILKQLDVKKFEQDIQLSLNDFGQRVVKKAKELAPTDEGGWLQQSINTESGKLSVTIEANVNYAAYIEFGTRKFAAAYVSSLPADWKTFAAQFQGPGGGTFAEFIKSIMAWVKRKGIDEELAYPIALKILREGIKPQPYLYPAIKDETPLLLKDLQNLLQP